MDPQQRARIDALTDRVVEAIESPRNRARGGRQPGIVFNTEDPIIWSHVFGFDANVYFTDAAFYLEHQLLQKLWRWDNFDDDDMPITRDITAWLGHYPEYTYLGIEVPFSPRGVPLIQTDHPMTRNPDLGLLKPIEPWVSGWMPRTLQWYDTLRDMAGDRLGVGFGMTWNRGCLDIAMALRGYEGFVEDMMVRKPFAHDLLKFLVEQRCRWYDAYYERFGIARGPVGFADDWINVPFITPGMFEEFLLPRYLELEAYHGGIWSIHSCGDQVPVQKYLLQIESLGAVEVSPWTSLTDTLANVPATKHIQVSLHPNDVLHAGEEEMEAQLRFIMESCQGRPYGIGTSGLTPTSPDIDVFIAKIRTWTGIARRLRS
jgi:hypothetical protein